jgi:hypothetical protein
MLTNPTPSPAPVENPKQPGKRRWTYFGLVVLILLGYIGFVFWTRSQDTKLIERERADKAAAAQKDEAEKSFESLGGADFKILSFYATPGIVKKGDSVNMCYGVSNAKTVTLDPPVANVWPAATRCLDITPAKTTKYVLTADDGKGNKQSADLTVTVK